MRHALAALVAVGLAATAHAAERTVVKLAFTTPAKATIDVWVTRADAPGGAVTLKVIARGVGPRPQALTLYDGGGGDDGPGVEDVRAISAKIVELPAAGKVLRVDFAYRVPGTRDEETRTTLVGFEGRTHRVLELTTRRAHQRSKQCREIEETTLLGELAETEGMLSATTRVEVEPALADDDTPLDKGCVAPTGAQRAVYRWTGDRYVEATPETSDDDDD